MMWVLLLPFFAAELHLPSLALPTIENRWVDHYDEALQNARDAELPLLLVLDNQATNRQPWGNSPELNQLSQRYSLCRIDVDSPIGERIAEAYNAKQFPYTLITDQACDQIVFRGAGEFDQSFWLETLAKHAAEKPNSDKSTTDIPNEEGFVSAGSSAFKSSDREAAERQARRNGRGLIVFVTMQGCGYCEVMKQKTLTDPAVQSTVGGSFESVIVHREQDAAWVEQQEVRIYPTTLLIGRHGEVQAKLEGFLDVEEFLAKIQSHQATSLSMMW